jgi:acyl-CoA reductase-like NAD-dependent aldehyde dehydrogenase
MEAGMYVYSTEAQRQQARNVFKSLNKQYPALLRFRLDTLASHPIQPQAPAETQGANHLRDAARAALDAFDAWMDNDDEDAAEALDKAFDTLREALPTPAAPRKDAQP